jgi:hypothetical protein
VNVAHLQQHLTDLARLMASSGAGKVADDLSAIQEALTAFRDLPLKGFADFLVRAEAFSRGEVPLPGKRGGKGKVTGTPGAKKSSPDLDAFKREALELWEGATGAGVNRERVEEFTKRLSVLTKDGLLDVAASLTLTLKKSASKPVMQEAIGKWILERRGSKQRSDMTDRGGDVHFPLPASATIPLS